MKDQSLFIRKSTEDDIAAIVDLWKEFMDFHAARDRHFARSEDGHERFAEFISGRLESKISCVLVAEQNQDIVGYCLAMVAKYPPVFLCQEYGSISDLAVTAKCRREGVGEALVQGILAWFAERNIQRIEVRVAVSNEVSTSFWRKMGFEPYLEIMAGTLSRFS